MAFLTFLHLYFSSSAVPIATSPASITLIGILLMALISMLRKLKYQLNLKLCCGMSKRLPLPPGPMPWPIIGNLPELLKNKPTFRWLHLVMEQMNTEIACIRIGNVHVVTVSCPKIAVEILKKHDAVFASRPLSMAAHNLSGGYLSTVLVPYGEQWKKMRRVLTSEIVTPAKHRWLHDKRAEEADNLVKYVLHQCKSFGNGNVNVRRAARTYSGNVIRKLMFGKRYFGKCGPDGGPTVAEEEHVEALFTALGYTFSFCISDYFPFLTGLDLDGHEKIVKEASRVIKKHHDPIIDERIKEWRRYDTVGPSGDGDKVEKKELEDLLDVLITLKDSDGKPLLTSDEVKAQTTEIILAAVDNPSNAVEWALAEMINQPELLEKAVKELDRVVGKDRLVQESDIPNLNYIKACAREAFRLHPVAPFNIPHVAMEDTVITDHFIPKGTHVLLSRVGLGRNPMFWEEPLRFNPERHLDGDCSGGSQVVLTEPQLRFISFSTGRRGCIAATLGTAMTVMLFVRLLQGFTWSAPSGVPNIDLSESMDDLSLAKPLIACVEPRLPLYLYPLN